MEDLDELLVDLPGLEDLPVAAVIAEAVVDDDADNANNLGAVGAVRGIQMHHFNVAEGEDGGDAHVLVRLRGRDVESLNSYLCDWKACTCVSVLPGWSPRTKGCQRIVDRCQDHPEEAFYVSQHGRTPLHEACLRGSCRHVIKALLQANSCGVMDHDLDGNTPLHLLFVNYSTHGIMNPQELDEIVGDLLNFSFNFSFLASSTNIEGCTALHMACRARETMVDPNSLKRLLAASPACAAKLTSRNQTALRIHCERRNASPEVAQLLLDAHPDALLVLGGEGWAPLHYAAFNKNLELIRFLVDYNPQAARVRTAPHNHSPLHLLCRYGLSLCHLPAFEALRNADPDAILQRDAPNSYTPLHLVCRSPRIPLDIVKRMLATNPKAAAIADADDYLPLHHACKTGCEPDIVKHLLEVYPEGAHSLTRKQDTALSLACTSNKHVETIKILIQANTTALIKTNDYGFAPLHCVCRAYQPRMGIVEALLDACPSCVTLKTHAGETPVHLACSNAGAFVGVLQLLTVAQNKSVASNGGELQKTVVPSDKRMTNKIGNTPLHDACFRGSPFEHIETLAMANPEWISVRNNAGYSPLQVLCKNGRIDERIVTTFSRIGGPEIFSVSDATGNTPLHSAMREDINIDTLKCLIRALPDALHLKTIYGDSPLHLACFRRASADVVREIAVASSNGQASRVLETNTSGQTPIGIAMEEFRSVCRGAGVCCVVSEFRPEQTRAFQVLACLVKILYYGSSYPDESNNQSLIRACVSLHRQDVRLDPAFIRRAIHLYPEEARIMDEEGNFPLHIEASIPVEKMPLLDAATTGCCEGKCHKRMGVLRILLEIYPDATRFRNTSGEFPLGLMIQNGRLWGRTIALALRAFPPALHWYKGLDDRLLPLILEKGSKECGNDTLFALINSRPDVLASAGATETDDDEGVFQSTRTRIPLSSS